MKININNAGINFKKISNLIFFVKLKNFLKKTNMPYGSNNWKIYKYFSDNHKKLFVK